MFVRSRVCSKRVLQITGGIGEMGGMQWELLGCLLLGWILIYGIICRGIHQSGKVTQLETFLQRRIYFARLLLFT